jgi:hypothetical protein
LRHELAHRLGFAERFHGGALLVAQRPEALAEQDLRLHVLDALLGEVAPAAVTGLLEDRDDGLGRRNPFLVLGRAEGVVVAVHHFLDDVGRRHPRQVRAARRGGERQAEADQVMRRIADDGLVEVADLDGNLAV